MFHRHSEGKPTRIKRKSMSTIRISVILDYWSVDIYLLTYSMKQSPSWEINWFAASQEIPHILCSPKVHYSIHKYPPPVHILSQINPAHAPHFLQIQLNVILLSIPGSSKWPLSLRFPHQNPVYTSPLPHTCYMLRPSNSSSWSPE